jgi:predicted transcriptional regulator
MPRPGQAHVVITEESIAAVNSLVRENRRITTREIADSLSVSKGTVDTILHEQLNEINLCINLSVPLSLGHALYFVY